MNYNTISLVISAVGLLFTIGSFIFNEIKEENRKKELIKELNKVDDDTRKELRQTAVKKYIEVKPEMVSVFIKKND